MSKLQELIEVLSDEDLQARTYQAKRSHVCKICQRPAIRFHSDLAKLDYEISTICQDCQDYYYNLPDS